MLVSKTDAVMVILVKLLIKIKIVGVRRAGGGTFLCGKTNFKDCSLQKELSLTLLSKPEKKFHKDKFFL